MQEESIVSLTNKVIEEARNTLNRQDFEPYYVTEKIITAEFLYQLVKAKNDLPQRLMQLHESLPKVADYLALPKFEKPIDPEIVQFAVFKGLERALEGHDFAQKSVSKNYSIDRDKAETAAGILELLHTMYQTYLDGNQAS